jgi:hypothetical protein
MSGNTQTHTISKSKSQGIAITTTSSSESQETATTTTTLPPKRTTTNEYSSAKERLQNFFDAEISMYVLPDIDRLTNEIRPDNRGLRGCTIPLAMLLFAVIDLFGFLMRPDERANKRKTWKNFKYLLSQKSGYFPRTYDDNWKKIMGLFRHGVMHQFFPKASGIAKAGPNRPLIYEENNIPVLNIDILSRDLVQAIDQIRRDVVDGTDQELVVRMNSRLDSLAEDDYQELEELS